VGIALDAVQVLRFEPDLKALDESRAGAAADFQKASASEIVPSDARE
jgi:hypothetical protein